MKVVIVEPGKYAREAEIENTLEAEQAVVGGLIECVYPWRDSNAILVCNDSGLIDGLPLNRQINEYTVIAGTFFICGVNGENFGDLTAEQVEHYKKKYQNPELFFRTPDGVKGRPCTPAIYNLFMGTSHEPKKPHPNHER